MEMEMEIVNEKKKKKKGRKKVLPRRIKRIERIPRHILRLLRLQQSSLGSMRQRRVFAPLRGSTSLQRVDLLRAIVCDAPLTTVLSCGGDRISVFLSLLRRHEDLGQRDAFSEAVDGVDRHEEDDGCAYVWVSPAVSLVRMQLEDWLVGWFLQTDETAIRRFLVRSESWPPTLSDRVCRFGWLRGRRLLEEVGTIIAGFWRMDDG